MGVSEKVQLDWHGVLNGPFSHKYDLKKTKIQIDTFFSLKNNVMADSMIAKLKSGDQDIETGVRIFAMSQGQPGNEANRLVDRLKEQVAWFDNLGTIARWRNRDWFKNYIASELNLGSVKKNPLPIMTVELAESMIKSLHQDFSEYGDYNANIWKNLPGYLGVPEGGEEDWLKEMYGVRFDHGNKEFMEPYLALVGGDRKEITRNVMEKLHISKETKAKGAEMFLHYQSKAGTEKIQQWKASLKNSKQQVYDEIYGHFWKQAQAGSVMM